MKKLIPILASLTLLAILTGCGGSAPQTPTEPAPPTQTFPSPTMTPVPTETLTQTSEATQTAEILPTESAASTSGFASSVYPIFEAKCIKCHGVEQVKEGLSMLTYEELMAGSFNGPVVIPGNADSSLLVELIARGKMPNRGEKVTETELQIIKDWINAGALND